MMSVILDQYFETKGNAEFRGLIHKHEIYNTPFQLLSKMIYYDLHHPLMLYRYTRASRLAYFTISLLDNFRIVTNKGTAFIHAQPKTGFIKIRVEFERSFPNGNRQRCAFNADLSSITCSNHRHRCYPSPN